MREDYNWKPRYLDALRSFLGKPNGSASEVYSAMNSLSRIGRHGMWHKVASFLRVKQQVAQDFYHNTWVKQFFQDVKPFREELLQLTAQMGRMGCTPKDVVAQFCERRREMHFNHREIHQIAAMKLKAMAKLKTEDESDQIATEQDAGESDAHRGPN